MRNFLMLIGNYDYYHGAIMCENSPLFSICIYINNLGLRKRFPALYNYCNLGRDFPAAKM